MVGAVFVGKQLIIWRLKMISTKKNNDSDKDKNLQDDWVPDQQRRVGANSEAITEYGGDIKRKESIIEKKENKSSLKDSNNWKKV